VKHLINYCQSCCRFSATRLRRRSLHVFFCPVEKGIETPTNEGLGISNSKRLTKRVPWAIGWHSQRSRPWKSSNPKQLHPVAAPRPRCLGRLQYRIWITKRLRLPRSVLQPPLVRNAGRGWATDASKSLIQCSTTLALALIWIDCSKIDQGHFNSASALGDSPSAKGELQGTGIALISQVHSLNAKLTLVYYWSYRSCWKSTNSNFLNLFIH